MDNHCVRFPHWCAVVCCGDFKFFFLYGLIVDCVRSSYDSAIQVPCTWIMASGSTVQRSIPNFVNWPDVASPVSGCLASRSEFPQLPLELPPAEEGGDVFSGLNRIFLVGSGGVVSSYDGVTADRIAVCSGSVHEH